MSKQRQPRADYENNSLSRNRPWEAEKISRRTWERRRARDASVGSRSAEDPPAAPVASVSPLQDAERPVAASVEPEAVADRPSPAVASVEPASSECQEKFPKIEDADFEPVAFATAVTAVAKPEAAENFASRDQKIEGAAAESFAPLTQNPSETFETRSRKSEADSNFGSQEPKIADPLREWWNEPLPDWREGKLEIHNLLTGKTTIIDLRRKDEED